MSELLVLQNSANLTGVTLETVEILVKMRALLQGNMARLERKYAVMIKKAEEALNLVHRKAESRKHKSVEMCIGIAGATVFGAAVIYFRGVLFRK